jgi:hypothetical protein
MACLKRKLSVFELGGNQILTRSQLFTCSAQRAWYFLFYPGVNQLEPYHHHYAKKSPKHSAGAQLAFRLLAGIYSW